MSSGLDPFVDGRGDTSFYISATLKQRIDLVRHLIGFGRQIVVLTGPPGSGKSALLGQITDDETAQWHVLQLNAGPTLNGEALLQRLCEDLGLEGDGGELSTLNAIREAVTAANHRGHTTVLTIDDADALPADTAGCLAALAHAGDPDAELKIVLSADPGESAIIDQLQVETEQHALLHVVEVPRLSDEQTREMLQHRWQAAYGEETFPFSDIEMAQIYQQAAGLPGKAIVLARQVQIMSGGPAGTERDPARLLMIGGVVAIVLLAIVALLNSSASRDTEPALVELELPGDVLPLALPAQLTTPEATISGLPPSRPDGVSNEPPTAAPASKPEPEPEPEPEPAEPALTELTQSSGNAETAPPRVSRPEPPAPAPQATPAPANPPPVPAPAPPPAKPPQAPKPAATPAYTVAWLKSQPETGYVLQLFGVRDRAAAEKFVRSRKISATSAVLTTRHAGQPWYVVLYGHYPDRSAAQAAIGDLPAKLAGTSPWARPLKSLE